MKRIKITAISLIMLITMGMMAACSSDSTAPEPSESSENSSSEASTEESNPEESVEESIEESAAQSSGESSDIGDVKILAAVQDIICQYEDGSIETDGDGFNSRFMPAPSDFVFPKITSTSDIASIEPLEGWSGFVSVTVIGGGQTPNMYIWIDTENGYIVDMVSFD